MNLKPLITVLIGGLALISTIASAAGVGWILTDGWIAGGPSGVSISRMCTACTGEDLEAMFAAGLGWMKQASIDSGLFRYCTETSSIDICETLKPDDTLRTCQAFIIIAILVNIVACFAGVYLVLRDTAKTPLLVPALYAVAAFSCLICGAVYAGKFKLTSGADYGWGFALCWVSMILYIVAAVLSFVFRGAAEAPAAA